MKKKWNDWNEKRKIKRRKRIERRKARWNARRENMKARWNKFMINFKPSYKVDVTMYQFVPGMPVKANKTRHKFDKGAFDEAKLFFESASKKTRDHNIAPVEINLVKGRRRVVTSRHFGPVKALKQMKMSA